MKLTPGRKQILKITLVALAVGVFWCPKQLYSQKAAPEVKAGSTAGETKDPHAAPGWQPMQVPPPGVRYIGDEACAKCHADKTSTYQHSAMAQALFPGATNPILRGHGRLDFQLGPYSYSLVQRGADSTYTVRDRDGNTISEPVLWAFGHGEMGQTYVFAHKGTYYESRVSFYRRGKLLDLTLGAPNSTPASLLEAAGREMKSADVKDCFGCHATNLLTSAGEVKLGQMTPGVRCEACHGPGERHALAMNAGSAGRSADKGIASLKKMSAEETSTFCGACHRTWDQVMLLPGQGGIGNVRFQPYRLTNSPCYDTEDKRIGCTACHNPHEEVKREAIFYDAKCTACHAPAKSDAAAVKAVQAKGKVPGPCPIGKQSCVTCHMPKVEVPGAHYGFTDHHIRVVKAGQPYPL